MNGAGRVGWLFWPSTRTTPSNTTRPVAVASRSFRVLVFTRKLLAVVLTLVSSSPTPVQATSKDTWWVTPRLSLAMAEPEAVTLLRFSVLVMVAGGGGATPLNDP